MKLSRNKIAKLLKTGNQSRRRFRSKSLSNDDLILDLHTSGKNKSLFAPMAKAKAKANGKTKSKHMQSAKKKRRGVNLRYKTLKREERMQGGAELTTEQKAVLEKIKVLEIREDNSELEDDDINRLKSITIPDIIKTGEITQAAIELFTKINKPGETSLISVEDLNVIKGIPLKPELTAKNIPPNMGNMGKLSAIQNNTSNFLNKFRKQPAQETNASNVSQSLPQPNQSVPNDNSQLRTSKDGEDLGQKINAQPPSGMQQPLQQPSMQPPSGMQQPEQQPSMQPPSGMQAKQSDPQMEQQRVQTSNPNIQYSVNTSSGLNMPSNTPSNMPSNTPSNMQPETQIGFEGNLSDLFTKLDVLTKSVNELRKNQYKNKQMEQGVSVALLNQDMSQSQHVRADFVWTNPDVWKITSVGGKTFEEWLKSVGYPMLKTSGDSPGRVASEDVLQDIYTAGVLLTEIKELKAGTTTNLSTDLKNPALIGINAPDEAAKAKIQEKMDKLKIIIDKFPGHIDRLNKLANEENKSGGGWDGGARLTRASINLPPKDAEFKYLTDVFSKNESLKQLFANGTTPPDIDVLRQLLITISNEYFTYENTTKWVQPQTGKVTNFKKVSDFYKNMFELVFNQNVFETWYTKTFLINPDKSFESFIQTLQTWFTTLGPDTIGANWTVLYNGLTNPLAGKNAGLQKQIDTLTKDLSAANAKIQELTTKLETINTKQTEKEEEIANLKQQSEEAKQAAATAASTKQEEIAQLKKDAEKKQQEHADAINKLTQEKTAREAELTAAKEETKNASEAEKEAFIAKAKELSDRIAELTNKISDENKTATSENLNLTEELQAAKDAEKRLLEKQENFEKQLKAKEAELEKINTEKAQTETQLKAQEANANTSSGKVAELEEKLTAIQNENEETKKKLAAFEEERAKSTSVLYQSTEQYNNTMEELDKLKKQLEEAKSVLEKTKNDLEDANSDRDKVKKELIAANKENFNTPPMNIISLLKTLSKQYEEIKAGTSAAVSSAAVSSAAGTSAAGTSAADTSAADTGGGDSNGNKIIQEGGLSTEMITSLKNLTKFNPSKFINLRDDLIAKLKILNSAVTVDSVSKLRVEITRFIVDFVKKNPDIGIPPMLVGVIMNTMLRRIPPEYKRHPNAKPYLEKLIKVLESLNMETLKKDLIKYVPIYILEHSAYAAFAGPIQTVLAWFEQNEDELEEIKKIAKEQARKNVKPGTNIAAPTVINPEQQVMLTLSPELVKKITEAKNQQKGGKLTRRNTTCGGKKTIKKSKKSTT